MSEARDLGSNPIAIHEITTYWVTFLCKVQLGTKYNLGVCVTVKMVAMQRP